MKNASSILQKILLPYQYDWVRDVSRFKIGLWSRQTGKSFATACEAVVSCQAKKNNMWVVLSAGERQALEWMEKARKWAEAVKLAVSDDHVVRSGAEAVMTRSEIRFANGSRIVAIPANPDTARGYSANLVLDEFAIHERPFDIWAAIYPSITSPFGGEKVLRIVSTPKGRGNKFADLWEHNDAYSKHKVTIEDAVREGLKQDLDVLRKGVDDPDIWAQEYLCEFVDNSQVLLPYDMIGPCEYTPSRRIEDDAAGAKRFIGVDIGRSKDLTVIIEAVEIAGVLTVIRVDVLRKMMFADQLKMISNRASARDVQRCCIDATGIGAMIAEEARRKVGSKVLPVVFTVSTKADMYGSMRRRFEDKTIRIPADRELREDLHAVQKLVSTGGNVAYSAPRSTDGHSDRAAALALCIHAASRKGIFVAPWGPSVKVSMESRRI